MDFEKLKIQLNQTLPGAEAQRLMSPRHDEERFKIKERPDAKKGGVMILFFKQDNHWQIPLIKRPDYPGVHGGQVSFPGGKMDPDDHSIESTALRETEEEIGVSQKDIKIIGRLSQLYIPPSNFIVTPIVGFLASKPTFVPDPREVEKIFEVDIEELLDARIRKETVLNLSQGYRIKTPYYDLRGQIVWGATAMILSELLTLVKNH